MTTLRAAFTGTVRCAPRSGSSGLELCGTDRQTCQPLQVLFGGVSAAPVAPPTLQDVELHALAADRFEIRSAATVFMVSARALHLHVDVAAPFYAALRLPRAGWCGRLGWAVLLTVLRLPLAGRLLRRRGG